MDQLKAENPETEVPKSADSRPADVSGEPVVRDSGVIPNERSNERDYSSYVSPFHRRRSRNFFGVFCCGCWVFVLVFCFPRF